MICKQNKKNVRKLLHGENLHFLHTNFNFLHRVKFFDHERSSVNSRTHLKKIQVLLLKKKCLIVNLGIFKGKGKSIHNGICHFK